MKLKFENVCVKKSGQTILENVNFSIDENSIVCIVGKNGAGKTSILKLLTGIEKYEGNILINNEKITSDLISKNIAYVPQEANINLDMTLFDYVSLGIRAIKPFYARITSEDKKVINDVLIRLGLIELKDRIVKTLSGGQKQKASIAIALIQNKNILIMDEPTSFLDLETINEIIKLIKQIKAESKTVILTLHEINYATKMTDKIIAIKNKTIFFEGTPSEVITYENIKNLYDIKPKMVEIDGKSLIVDFDYKES